MKITLVSKGTTPQDIDLINEAQVRGYGLENVQFATLNLEQDQNLFHNTDLVYWRVGNPKIREIAALFCEKKGIPFVNSGYYKYPLLGSKAYQMYILNTQDIHVPNSLLFAPKLESDYDKLNITFPCVMKDLINAQGKGVTLINSLPDLKQKANIENSPVVLLQEFLPNNGDYRVLVIGKNAIGAYKREPQEGEFRSNISLGGQAVTVVDKEKIEVLGKIAEKAAAALGLEIAGIDIMESNGEYYVIETNSIPQWQGFKEATKMNVAGKIYDYFETLV